MIPFSFAVGYRCISCHGEFSLEVAIGTCTDCGPIHGTLDVLYDVELLRQHFHPGLLRDRTDATLWRYHEILPIRNQRGEDLSRLLPVGGGPLVELDPRANVLGPRRILLKDDTRQISGSTKDRATAVGLAHARELRADCVAAASTGNAAASLSALSARIDLPCRIFAPASAPPAKLVQIRAHGARLYAVEGNYDQAFDLCMEACARMGFYNRNTAVNPMMGEGKKTLSLEIFEQLGFRAPNAVFVPVGDGCILGGVYKGFQDLCDLELIPALPRLIGVQAEGSAALAEAWRRGEGSCRPIEAHTIADSLSVSLPRDSIKALRAVRNSRGAFVTVSDAEILEGISWLARRAGIFVEPAAGAVLYGLKRAMSEGIVGPEDEVVLILTGSGLKDIAAAEKAAAWNPPVILSPEMDALTRLLEEETKRS